MAQFQQNDTVRLITGGPQMSLIAVNEVSGKATCVWLENDQRRVKEFDLVVLKKVQQPANNLFVVRPRSA
jgi:uncharacterized protein YodC (DUF2158 family)